MGGQAHSFVFVLPLHPVAPFSMSAGEELARKAWLPSSLEGRHLGWDWRQRFFWRQETRTLDREIPDRSSAVPDAGCEGKGKGVLARGDIKDDLPTRLAPRLDIAIRSGDA